MNQMDNLRSRAFDICDRLMVSLKRRYAEKYTISPEELLNYLRIGMNPALCVLLVDCRPANDFRESTIKYENDEGKPKLEVINVPPCSSQASRDASFGADEVANSALEIARSRAQMVVLMDWDSDSLDPKAHVTQIYGLLSEALAPQGGGKMNTRLLNGGFKSWFYQPASRRYVTNEVVLCPAGKKDACPRQGCPFIHRRQCYHCKDYCLNPDDAEQSDRHVRV